MARARATRNGPSPSHPSAPDRTSSSRCARARLGTIERHLNRRQHLTPRPQPLRVKIKQLRQHRAPLPNRRHPADASTPTAPDQNADRRPTAQDRSRPAPPRRRRRRPADSCSAHRHERRPDAGLTAPVAGGAFRSALRSTSFETNDRRASTSPTRARNDRRAQRREPASPPTTGADARASNVRATSAQSAASSPDGENACPGARASQQQAPPIHRVLEQTSHAATAPSRQRSRLRNEAPPPTALAASAPHRRPSRRRHASTQLSDPPGRNPSTLNSQRPRTELRSRPRIRHPLVHARATVQSRPTVPPGRREAPTSGSNPSTESSQSESSTRSEPSDRSRRDSRVGAPLHPSARASRPPTSCRRRRLPVRLQLPWRRTITDTPGRRRSAPQVAQGGDAPCPCM